MTEIRKYFDTDNLSEVTSPHTNIVFTNFKIRPEKGRPFLLVKYELIRGDYGLIKINGMRGHIYQDIECPSLKHFIPEFNMLWWWVYV